MAYGISISFVPEDAPKNAQLLIRAFDQEQKLIGFEKGADIDSYKRLFLSDG
jgi:hypothetical protein